MRAPHMLERFERDLRAVVAKEERRQAKDARKQAEATFYHDRLVDLGFSDGEPGSCTAAIRTRTFAGT